MSRASTCSRRSTPTRVVLRSIAAGLVMSLGAALLGCTHGPAGPTMTEPTETAVAAPVESTSLSAPADEQNWRVLAEDIIAAWTEALRELNLLLEGLPDPGAVESEVRVLKERYVLELVELGRAREQLGGPDRASVDSRLRSAMDAMGDDTVYLTYADTYEQYVETGAGIDFCNLMASFNILTQYADFSLLKMQAPEEAARLGIE